MGEIPALRLVPFLVLAGIVAYTFSVYPSLPPHMAVHWGIDGQPNGWASRKVGAWLLPAVMLITLVVFGFVRRAGVGIVLDVVVSATVTFEAIIQVAILNVARGHAIDINTTIYAALGALFVILGLAMPFTHRNRFVGFRTRWTLADDEVWRRTHETGGMLMVAAGILTLVAGLTASPRVAFAVLIASTLGATLGSVLLSYIYWRQR